MNALINAPLTGELIAPEAFVRVIGKTHPLNGGRIECHVRAGLSITEILIEALASRPGMVLRRDFIVHIDGNVIEERNWSRVRLKAGATLTFTPRLQNGNILRTVLSLVVVVAAFALAGPAGGWLAGTALGAAVGISASVAGALVSAGIVLAGTMALNALFPTRPPAEALASVPGSLNSIQGAQNQSNPFGPVPVVLGRHRQSPYYAAKPYTEIIGDDQYLRLAFCWGYGPLRVSQILIGDTPIESFDDIEIEQRVGLPGEAPLTLYPGEVDEQQLSIQLRSVDGWQTRTTADDTDEISVDVTAPQGLYTVNKDNGNLEGYAVFVAVQYALAGTGFWSDAGSIQLASSTIAQRRGMRIVVPRGKYDVRLQKVTGDANSDKIRDEVDWTALRSVKNAAPIVFPQPLCLTAIRIKATNQLSGVINNLSGFCESFVTSFDGAKWNSMVVSQSPADLFRHVLQGPANARPDSDDRIDIGNLQVWAAYCSSNGFAFNQVITTVGSVYDKLCDIAAAGRAVPTFIDGKWGVIWDRPNDTPVQHFTPRNSWGFQGQRTYAQQPHGWRVNFINESNSYTADERIVYDDGYDATNATLFEGIQFPGVTNPALIWKHGRFHIAQARLRPEKISLNVGWEHLVCTRGDRVRVTHDVLLIGLASGRLKGVEGQIVTFDEIVTVEEGKSYGMQIRVPQDARSLLFSISADVAAGDYTSLPLVGDLSLLKEGNLFAFGETDQESAVYRVQSIAHQKDLIATLTLVDDAPEISQADKGAIPDYDPHVSIPPDPFTLAPQNFRYVEAVDGQGNSVRALIRLSWTAARRGKIGSTEVQIASGDLDWRPVSVLPYPQFSLDVPLESPGVWSYRVRFLFDDGSFSGWTTLSKLTLLGLSAAPDDVQNIRAAAYVDDNTSLAWDEIVDYRPVRYAVRKGDSWEAGLELGTIAHPPFAAHGNGNYLVKAYCGPDSSRAYSVNAASVEIAGASLVKNVIAVRDEKADGWNGVFTGTVAKSGSLIRTGGAGDFRSLTDVLSETDILNKGGQGNGTYEIAPSRYIDARRATACRVTVTWKGTGQVATDDMLSNPDILSTPDFLAAGSTDLVGVYPEISFAQNDYPGDVFNLHPDLNPGNDIFAEPDVFSSDISFGPWIKYEPGLYVGRFFRARLVLETMDPQVVAIALEFTLSVDVPDRVDTWGLVGGVGTSLNGITVPAAGLAIVFASNGKTIAEPFNGGPNTDDVPLIQITNTSSSNFDFEVTGLTKSGCTIVPRLAGTPTDAPKTNITIQGW